MERGVKWVVDGGEEGKGIGARGSVVLVLLGKIDSHRMVSV